MSTTLTTSEWTHPTTGEVRRYLDNEQVWDLIVSDDVHGVANMNRILLAKFWLDADGALHIERLVERGRIAEAAVREAIEAALASVETEQGTEPAVVEDEAIVAAESATEAAQVAAAGAEGIEVVTSPRRAILTDTRTGRTLTIVDESVSEWAHYGWTADDEYVPGRHHVGRDNRAVAALVREWIAAR